MVSSMLLSILLLIPAVLGSDGIVCNEFSDKDSTNYCKNLKAVTRTTALICQNEISALRNTCDDTKNADSSCDCFSYSPYHTCSRLDNMLTSVNFYGCAMYYDFIITNLPAMITTQVESNCEPELNLIRKAQNICKTTTATKIPICDLVPDSPDLISCDEVPVYLKLKLPKGDEKCRSKSNVLLSAKRVCLPELVTTTTSTTTTTTATTTTTTTTTATTTTMTTTTTTATTTTTMTTTATTTTTTKSTLATKRSTTERTTAVLTTTPSTTTSTGSSSTIQTSFKATSRRRSTAVVTTTTSSKTCKSGDKGCITIKFYQEKTCGTSDAVTKASVHVLANGKCNRISTDKSTYHYKLSCGGNAITGSFYCDESCRKCRFEKMQRALDGTCVNEPNFSQDPDSKDGVDLIFTGNCEATTTEFLESPLAQVVIIFVTAPIFLIVVVVTALLMGYVLCNISKHEEDAETASATEVVGEVLEMQQNSSSMSTSGSGSRDKSHLQGRGAILIDEYGIPIDDNSSSEIMVRIPQHPLRGGAAFHGQARGPEAGAEAAMPRLHVITSPPAASASSSTRAHLNRMHVKKGNSPRSGSRSASGSRSSSHGRNASAPQRNGAHNPRSGSDSPRDGSQPNMLGSHRTVSRTPISGSRPPANGSRTPTNPSRTPTNGPRTPTNAQRTAASIQRTPSSGSNPHRNGPHTRTRPYVMRSGSGPQTRGQQTSVSHRDATPQPMPTSNSVPPNQPTPQQRSRTRVESNSKKSASFTCATTHETTNMTTTYPLAVRPNQASENTAVLNARKQEWVRVMMEHNVDRTKAEELAREHSRVDELAESVENGTLSDGAIMASRLHHCDAAFLKTAKTLTPVPACSPSRALSAGVVPLIPPASTAYTAYSMVSKRDSDIKASNLALRDAPVLHDNVAKGQCGHDTYKGICLLGKGGFGEIYKGCSDRTGAPFALKRQMVVQESDANVHDGRKLLQLQLKRMRGLMRETRVYFSSTLNISTSRHLARIHDVVLVRNSAGSNEPLLVFEYADAPKYNTLSAWMKHYTTVVSKRDDVKMRLSFAIQMFSGLSELHYGSEADRLHEQQKWEEVLSRVMSKQLAKNIVGNKQTIHEVMAALRSHYQDGDIPKDIVKNLRAVRVQPLYAHQDMKGANMLLFGEGHRTRLALTDFGLTVQYNSMRTPPIHGGTLKYMAPEQWKQQTAFTPKRDIWSAGLILAQLFGGVKTKAKLKEYQVFCAKVNDVTQSIRQLLQRARAVSDAMMIDASEFSWRTKLSSLLQHCLAPEAERYTAFQCKHALVQVWSGLFPATPWKDFESALKPPKVAPCAAEWNCYDREAMSHTISRHMVNLMSERCEEAAKIAPPDFGEMIRQVQDDLRTQLKSITEKELSCSAKSRQARWNADSDNS